MSAPVVILTDDSSTGTRFSLATREIVQFTGGRCAISPNLPERVPALLVTTARSLLNLVKSGGLAVEKLGSSSVFVLAGGDPEAYQAVLGLAGAASQAFSGNEAVCVSVNESEPEVCGPFSGLSFGEVPAKDFVWIGEVPGVISLVKAQKGVEAVGFGRVGNWFFCGAARAADLEETQPRKLFDVKRCFFELVPLLLFIRRSFGEFPRKVPASYACLTVDDPLLRESHGRFRFREVLQVLEKEELALNVGFIPWNFRRSHSATAALVRSQRRISLAVHGCDHTKHEFGLRDVDARIGLRPLRWNE